MKRRTLALTAFLFGLFFGSCLLAFAQQPQLPQAPPTPAQIATNVGGLQVSMSMQQVTALHNLVDQWAATITSLQQQLAEVTKERNELKAKLEPNPAEPKK
jgi:hypothetical protein